MSIIIKEKKLDVHFVFSNTSGNKSPSLKIPSAN